MRNQLFSAHKLNIYKQTFIISVTAAAAAAAAAAVQKKGIFKYLNIYQKHIF
jgi:hypothetical protein